jgi:UDP:flavonoid glycosyltransferase YjiC (YdhE family)
MSEKKQTAYILVPPVYGHIFPITGIAHELTKKNFNVIFYGNIENREVIEKTGAQFRLYVHPTMASFKPTAIQKQSTKQTFSIMSKMIDYSYVLLPSLIQDIQAERPSLIVYDQLYVTAKYLIKYLKRNEPSSYKPVTVSFSPSLLMNTKMMREMFKSRNMLETIFWMVIWMLIVFVKQQVFNFYFNLRVINLFSLFHEPDDGLNLVAVFPELQPMRDTFDRRFQFVGSCIEEKVRSNAEIKDKHLKEFLDLFKPRDSIETPVQESNPELRLVFVSLGTMYNDNIEVFTTIIQAFKGLDRSDCQMPMKNLRIIMSVGDRVMERFASRIKNENYQLPANVRLFSSVPQIDVLKRASLFITHAGQNSTSEAIQYAVPVIAIPIFGDQPLVAARICNELKLGFRFDPLHLDAGEIGQAIEEMFVNRVYRDRMLELARVSRKYDGVQKSIELILNSCNSQQQQQQKSFKKIN